MGHRNPEQLPLASLKFAQCLALCVCVLVPQLRPTLCDSMDHSPRGSSVCGILQARMLEWGAIPSLGDLPDPGTEPRSALQADSSQSEPPEKSPNFQILLKFSYC